jgi:tetratricopeptide (TPR) repeat protein
MSQQTELKESFQQRAQRLQRELERAIRYQKAALLLVVYASEWVREEVERELLHFLREQGQTVYSLRVDAEHSDIPSLLAAQPAPERTVFFVSGLKWGGGEDGLNAYRALNLRRELFIERGLRVVFWLTEGEAVALAQHAPDFWAFRHRVVEFVEPPETAHRAAIARELAWLDLSDHTLREDTEAKIRLREALLADLPQGEETRAARLDLLFTLGGLYWAIADYEKALSAFQQAIALDEKDAAPWNGLGIVYYQQGRREEAIAAFQKAIALDEKYAAPWNNLGNVYRKQGRYEEAIAAYQQAIALDEKYATPWNGLGAVYADLGRREEAIAAYQQAIALDEKDAAPWNDLGAVYADLGRREEAIAAYQKAIALDEKDAAPWNDLGAVYADLGRREGAIAAYQKVIELAPESDTAAFAHNNLAGIYAEQRRFDLARHELAERIRLHPQNTFAPLIQLGVLARHEGLPESEQHFRQALAQWEQAWRDKYQSVAGLLKNKAIALLCLGQKEEALRTLAEAIRQRLPGDVIDFANYELLRTAPQPPEGIEEMIALLKEAQAASGEE